MRLQAPPGRWLVLVQMLIVTGFLYGDVSSEGERLSDPFNTFRSLDAQLSLLDGQFSRLKIAMEKIEKIRDLKRRAKAYQDFRRSKTVREIRSTVSSIKTTTRVLGSRQRIRKSHYGRVISRALSRRATAMKRSLHRV